MLIQYSKKERYKVYLIDDGTLDTVIEINGKEFRFDSEYADVYRNEKGEMTEKGLKELAEEIIYLGTF